MAISRLDMRIDENIKAIAEKAYALKGMKNLTEYVVKLIEEDARRVIKEHESLTLDDNAFDRFILACEKAKNPNESLKRAAKFAKDKGF